MGRTQVHLSQEELDLLDRAREATGASRSELIRRAVQATLANQSTLDRLFTFFRLAAVAVVVEILIWTQELVL